MKVIIHNSKQTKDKYACKKYPDVPIQSGVSRVQHKTDTYKDLTIYHNGSILDFSCTINEKNLSNIIESVQKNVSMISMVFFENSDCPLCEKAKIVLKKLPELLQKSGFLYVLDIFSPCDLEDERIKKLKGHIENFGYPSILLRRLDKLKVTDIREVDKISTSHIERMIGQILNKPTVYFFASNSCQACQEFQETWDKVAFDKSKTRNWIFIKKYDDEMEPQDFKKFNIYYYPTLVYRSPSGKNFKFERERSMASFLGYLEEVQIIHREELQQADPGNNDMSKTIWVTSKKHRRQRASDNINSLNQNPDQNFDKSLDHDHDPELSDDYGTSDVTYVSGGGNRSVNRPIPTQARAPSYGNRSVSRSIPTQARAHSYGKCWVTSNKYCSGGSALQPDYNDHNNVDVFYSNPYDYSEYSVSTQDVNMILNDLFEELKKLQISKN